MNEYQWYNNSFPALPAASETGTRNSKRLPVWLIALITSFLTSAVLITIFAAFVLPFLRTPTTIHYSGSDESPVQLPQADLAGFPIAQVSQKAAPSTVYISSTGIAGGFFNQPISLGSGTGVIVSNDGYIITSSSVVNSGTNIKVTLNDGQDIDAMVVGSDKKTDIAILKINADGLVPAVLGNSSQLNVGDPIVTVGNPLGPDIMNTVTYGIISGINNNVSLQNGSSMNLILTDADVSSGNAGGALFNASGEAVAIVLSNISSSSNIAFSVPINDVKPLLSSFLHTETPESASDDTPMIGITGSDESYGVVVESVSENYPGAKAGLKIGDVIIKADGTPVSAVTKLNEIRINHKRGETMVLTVYRDGETLDINVVLE